MPGDHARGLLDTNLLIHGARIDSAQLPEQAAITTITIAELSAGVLAASDDRERARRLEVLQRAESAFAPLPFDVAAARAYGAVTSAVRASGRSPRSRVADLMIAAVAASQGLPLFTTNIADFAGLSGVVAVIAVDRPDERH